MCIQWSAQRTAFCCCCYCCSRIKHFLKLVLCTTAALPYSHVLYVVLWLSASATILHIAEVTTLYKPHTIPIGDNDTDEAKFVFPRANAISLRRRSRISLLLYTYTLTYTHRYLSWLYTIPKKRLKTTITHTSRHIYA